MTVVEVLVAIMIFSVVLLASAGSMMNVSRSLVRSRASERAARFAASRIEALRLTACASRIDGADTLSTDGADWAATNSWTFTDAGRSTYRVRVVSRYRTGMASVRSDTLETSISCLI
jgi:type II secretory pathway pseudopilin PulG